MSDKIKLKDVCAIQNGFAFKSSKYADSGIRIIRITNVQKGYVEDEKPAFYPESEESSIRDYMLKEGDLLLSLTGNVGRVALLDKKWLPAALNQRVACLRIKDDRITKDYLYYALLSNKFESDCIKSSKGIAQKNMSTEWLKNYEIPLPDKQEQRTIVSTFRRLLAIIEDKTSQIKQLDDLVRARFIEMFGNCNQKARIGDVSTICRGASPRPISKFITDGNGENWIKIGDVNENDIFITSTKEKVTVDGANKSRRIKPGDFILSNSMSFGRPYISKIHGCVHDGWLIISDYDRTFLPLFFYYAIRSELVQAQFRKSVAGAVVKNLNSDLVRNAVIATPSLRQQAEFVKIAERADGVKNTIQESLEEAQALLNALMQEFFD